MKEQAGALHLDAVLEIGMGLPNFISLQLGTGWPCITLIQNDA